MTHESKVEDKRKWDAVLECARVEVEEEDVVRL
jgi:hypothetical protein